MSSHNSCKLLGTLVVAILLAVAAPPAQATDYTWEGTLGVPDDAWNTAANWVVPSGIPMPPYLPGAVPTAFDTAIFDNHSIVGAREIDLGAGAVAQKVSFQHTFGAVANMKLLSGATLTLGDGVGAPGVIEQTIASDPNTNNEIASDIMDNGAWGVDINIQRGTVTLSGRIGDAVNTVALGATTIPVGATLALHNGDPAVPNNISGSFNVQGGLSSKGTSLGGLPIVLDNGVLTLLPIDPSTTIVTLMDADFTGSPLVNDSITAADLDAGSLVGTWTVTKDGNSDIRDSAVPGVRSVLFDAGGGWDFTANFDANTLLSDGVTIDFDAYLRRHGGDSRPDGFQGLDSSGNVVFDVRIMAHNNSGNDNYHRLAYVDDTDTLQRVGERGDINTKTNDVPDTAMFETITLELSATTMDIKLEGVVLADADDVGYRTLGVTDIERLRIYSVDPDAGFHFDNLLTTGIPLPSPITTLTSTVEVKGASSINPTTNVVLGAVTLHGASTLSAVGGGSPMGDSLTFASTALDDTTPGAVTLSNTVDIAGGPLTLGAVNKTVNKTGTGKASFASLSSAGGFGDTATLAVTGGELEFTGKVGGAVDPITLTGTHATGAKLTFAHADPLDASNIVGGVTAGPGGTVSMTSRQNTSSLGAATIDLAGGQLDVNATEAPPSAAPRSTYEALILADSPILYYGFEEANNALPVDDLSPSGYDGVYVNQAAPGSPTAYPILGGGVVFDNNDDIIDVNHTIESNSVTYETWIYSDAFGQDEIMTHDGWSAGYVHYGFYPGGGVMRIGINGNFGDQKPNMVFNSAEWYHLVTTYDGDIGEVKFYVDGQLVDTKSGLGHGNDAKMAPGNIGGYNATGREWDGYMDEFALYDSVLTADQVAAHYAVVFAAVNLGHQVNATASSTINSTGESVILGDLDIDNGVTLTVNTADGTYLGFGTTAFTNLPAPGDVEFEVNSELRPGKLDDGGAAGIIITKTGDGDLVFDETTALGDADVVLIKALAGNLGIVGENAGQDPLGGAAVQVPAASTAGIVLASKSGDIGVGTAFDIDEDATMTAKMAYSGAAVGAEVTLGGTVDVADGKTLSLATENGYTFKATGALTGSGMYTYRLNAGTKLAAAGATTLGLGATMDVEALSWLSLETAQTNLADITAAVPVINVATEGAIGGDMTNARYNALGVGPQNVFLSGGSVLTAIGPGLEPVRADLHDGGATIDDLLWQGVEDLAGTYTNLGDDGATTIYRGVMMSTPWTSPGDFTGTLSENPAPVVHGFEVRLVPGIGLSGAIFNADSGDTVQFNTSSTLHLGAGWRNVASTADTFLVSGTPPSGADPGDTGTTLLSLDVTSAVPANVTFSIENGIVADAGLDGVDPLGVLNVDQHATYQENGLPTTGAINILDGGAVMYNTAGTLAYYNWNDGAMLIANNNVDWTGEPLPTDKEIDVVIVGGNRVFNNGLYLGDGALLSQQAAASNRTVTGTAGILPNTDMALDESETVIISAAEGRNFNVNMNVNLAGVNLQIGAPPGTDVYLPEGGAARIGLPQTGRVQLNGDSTTAHDVTIESGYLELANNDGDTFTFNSITVKDGAELEIRNNTNLQQGFMDSTLAPGGIFLEDGGDLRTWIEKVTPGGVHITTPIICTGGGGVIQEQAYLYIDEEGGPETEIFFFDDITFNNGADLEIDYQNTGRENVRLTLKTAGGTSSIRREPDQFSFQDVLTNGSGSGEIVVGDPSEGNADTNVYGTIGGPNPAETLTLTLANADLFFQAGSKITDQAPVIFNLVNDGATSQIDFYPGSDGVTDMAPANATVNLAGQRNILLVRAQDADNLDPDVDEGPTNVFGGQVNIGNTGTYVDGEGRTVHGRLITDRDGTNRADNGHVVFSNVHLADTACVELTENDSIDLTIDNLTLDGPMGTVKNVDNSSRIFINDIHGNVAAGDEVLHFSGDDATCLIGALDGVDLVLDYHGQLTQINLLEGFSMPATSTIDAISDDGAARVIVTMGSDGDPAKMLTTGTINLGGQRNELELRAQDAADLDPDVDEGPTNTLGARVNISNVGTYIDGQGRPVHGLLYSNRDGANLADNGHVVFSNVHLADTACVELTENDAIDLTIAVLTLDGPMGMIKNTDNSDRIFIGEINGNPEVGNEELRFSGDDTTGLIGPLNGVDIYCQGENPGVGEGPTYQNTSLDLLPGFVLNDNTVDLYFGNDANEVWTDPGTGTIIATRGVANWDRLELYYGNDQPAPGVMETAWGAGLTIVAGNKNAITLRAEESVEMDTAGGIYADRVYTNRFEGIVIVQNDVNPLDPIDLGNLDATCDAEIRGHRNLTIGDNDHCRVVFDHVHLEDGAQARFNESWCQVNIAELTLLGAAGGAPGGVGYLQNTQHANMHYIHDVKGDGNLGNGNETLKLVGSQRWHLAGMIYNGADVELIDDIAVRIEQNFGIEAGANLILTDGRIEIMDVDEMQENIEQFGVPPTGGGLIQLQRAAGADGNWGQMRLYYGQSEADGLGDAGWGAGGPTIEVSLNNRVTLYADEPDPGPTPGTNTNKFTGRIDIIDDADPLTVDGALLADRGDDRTSIGQAHFADVRLGDLSETALELGDGVQAVVDLTVPAGAATLTQDDSQTRAYVRDVAGPGTLTLGGDGYTQLVGNLTTTVDVQDGRVFLTEPATVGAAMNVNAGGVLVVAKSAVTADTVNVNAGGVLAIADAGFIPGAMTIQDGGGVALAVNNNWTDNSNTAGPNHDSVILIAKENYTGVLTLNDNETLIGGAWTDLASMTQPLAGAATTVNFGGGSTVLTVGDGVITAAVSAVNIDQDLQIAGAQAHTGPSAITSGRTLALHAGALSGGAVTVGDSAELQVMANNFASGQIEVVGTPGAAPEDPILRGVLDLHEATVVSGVKFSGGQIQAETSSDIQGALTDAALAAFGDMVFQAGAEVAFTSTGPGGVALNDNRTWTVNAGTARFDGAVTGAFTLTKAGPGTLRLNGGVGGATVLNLGTSPGGLTVIGETGTVGATGSVTINPEAAYGVEKLNHGYAEVNMPASFGCIALGKDSNAPLVMPNEFLSLGASSDSTYSGVGALTPALTVALEPQYQLGGGGATLTIAGGVLTDVDLLDGMGLPGSDGTPDQTYVQIGRNPPATTDDITHSGLVSITGVQTVTGDVNIYGAAAIQDENTFGTAPTAAGGVYVEPGGMLDLGLTNLALPAAKNIIMNGGGVSRDGGTISVADTGVLFGLAPPAYVFGGGGTGETQVADGAAGITTALNLTKVGSNQVRLLKGGTGNAYGASIGETQVLDGRLVIEDIGCLGDAPHLRVTGDGVAEFELAGTLPLDLVSESRVTLDGSATLQIAGGETLTATALMLDSAAADVLLTGGGTLDIGDNAVAGTGGALLTIDANTTLTSRYEGSVPDRAFSVLEDGILNFATAANGGAIGWMDPNALLKFGPDIDCNVGGGPALVFDVDPDAGPAGWSNGTDRFYTIEVGTDSLVDITSGNGLHSPSYTLETGESYRPVAHVKKTGEGTLRVTAGQYTEDDTTRTRKLHWTIDEGVLDDDGERNSLGTDASGWVLDSGEKRPTVANQHLEGIDILDGGTLRWSRERGFLPATAYGGLPAGEGDGFNTDELRMYSGATLEGNDLILGFMQTYTPPGTATMVTDEYPCYPTLVGNSEVNVTFAGQIDFASGIALENAAPVNVTTTGSAIRFTNSLPSALGVDVIDSLTVQSGTTSIYHNHTMDSTDIQGGTLEFDPGVGNSITYAGTVDSTGRIHATSGTTTMAAVITSPAAPPPLPPTDNLIANWKFDETTGLAAVNSATPGDKDGTLTNFAGDDSQWVAGINGGALAFDGVDDQVDIVGYTGISGDAPRTMAGWIKAPGTEMNKAIMSWGQNNAGLKWVFRIQDGNGQAGAIRVEVNGGYIVGETVVNDGAWHHVAAVLPTGATDVNQMLLYVDGNLETPSATLGEPINTASNWDVRIGADDRADYAFLGTIDDMYLYDVALDQADIQGVAGVLPAKIVVDGGATLEVGGFANQGLVDVLGTLTTSGAASAVTINVGDGTSAGSLAAGATTAGAFNLTNGTANLASLAASGTVNVGAPGTTGGLTAGATTANAFNLANGTANLASLAGTGTTPTATVGAGTTLTVTGAAGVTAMSNLTVLGTADVQTGPANAETTSVGQAAPIFPPGIPVITGSLTAAGATGQDLDIASGTADYGAAGVVDMTGTITIGSVHRDPVYQYNAGQLNYDFYQGAGVNDLAAIDDGVINGHNGGLFDLTPTSSSLKTDELWEGDHGSNYCQMWSGYFKPPQPGDYEFWVHGDDYELLWIDKNRNGDFEADGTEDVSRNVPPEGWNTQHTETINLDAGEYYPFAFTSCEEGGGASAQITITEPGGSAVRINPGLQTDWWYTMTLLDPGNQAASGTFIGGATTANVFNLRNGLATLASLRGVGVSPSVTVGAGTTMTVATDIRDMSSITVGGVLTTGEGTNATDELTIEPGATFDLTTGNVVVDYEAGNSPYDALLAKVVEGCNGGTWDGTGITSSAAAAQPDKLTALGIIQNDDPHPAVGFSAGLTDLEGVPVDETAVIIKYTWAGDANLDGIVDAADYDKIDTAWLLGAGWEHWAPGPRWAIGDFNYDGLIDAADYDLIDKAWLLSGGAMLGGAGGGGPVPTPEPATLVLLGLGAAVALVRKRR